MPTRDFARPFLKWAGGKTQLLAQFADLYPRKFNGYHEPFVGSAAVFFHLRALTSGGSLRASLNRITLSDSNPDLVTCYCVVRDHVDGLIQALAEHKRKHSHDHYYAVRALDPGRLDPVERAARFIYLNKTCFNGLYRVNSKGAFNVPMGRYPNPGIFDPDDVKLASQALKGVEIVCAPFAAVEERAARGDFVYLDPPYFPLSATANFTGYTRDSFREDEQRALAVTYRKLDRKGCKVMLSNSWTPFILDLYEGFLKQEVTAGRLINSNPGKRGKISELVVLNYDPKG